MYQVDGVFKLLVIMKNVVLLSVLFIFSCGKDKVIQLPEIEHSNISEIKDVSAAYLFYDETQKDSVELNRKNLISTTNWLVNVDKRLTLKQAIPHIKFLQEKKKNAGHKNEQTKNYFTCNDTSRKNLGFIEFTEIDYHLESSENYISNIIDLRNKRNIKSLSFNLNGAVSIINPNSEPYVILTKNNTFLNDLKSMDTTTCNLYLNFNENLTFQEYIKIKSKLNALDFHNLKISNQEFLHN